MKKGDRKCDFAKVEKVCLRNFHLFRTTSVKVEIFGLHLFFEPQAAKNKTINK